MRERDDRRGSGFSVARPPLTITATTPIIGQIIDVKSIPGADKIWVAQVDVGDIRSVQVIFGGDRRLRKDELVPIALPGVALPTGEVTRRKRWYSVKSEAELLSLDELGWTLDGPNEVVVFPPEETHSIGDTVPCGWVRLPDPTK